MALVFVYGTLKAGFRNQHWNGARLIGRYRSCERYPLLMLGPSYLPWLSELPGQGEQVLGELYEADAAELAKMDELEELDKADWYRRGEIALEPECGGERLIALVYFGSPVRAAREAVHAGPLREYTLEIEQRFLPLRAVQQDAAADAARFSTRRY
jgi:gamma-glutamylaminecyclotransferase